MKKIVIAIDGYSSTGKSTIAKELAAQLNYIYVDTGAMYRSVTLYAIDNDLIGEDYFRKEKLIDKLNEVNIDFQFNSELGYAEVYLNGENVESKIRTLEVSSYVSQVSTVSEVRQKLVEQQQKMGTNKGIVMDGRDIGTVVFPEAELKLFMTASPEIRAQRRYKELTDRGHQLNYDDVLDNVISRDYIDSNREDSPLMRATDAIEIDNSDLTIQQQLDSITILIAEKLNKKSD